MGTAEAVTPQALERVVLALLLEDVHEGISEWSRAQVPSARPSMWAGRRCYSADTVHDVLGDGAHLTVRRGRDNHERHPARASLLVVNEHRVDAAAVVCGASNQARQFCVRREGSRFSLSRTGTGRILLMYWTTPSNSVPDRFRLFDARAAKSIEEVAMAGTSNSDTDSCGRPRCRLCPGRVRDEVCLLGELVGILPLRDLCQTWHP